MTARFAVLVALGLTTSATAETPVAIHFEDGTPMRGDHRLSDRELFDIVDRPDLKTRYNVRRYGGLAAAIVGIGALGYGG